MPFRSFVFSPGVMAITPGEKTKERNNEMAQTSHHSLELSLCVVDATLMNQTLIVCAKCNG